MLPSFEHCVVVFIMQADVGSSLELFQIFIRHIVQHDATFDDHV